MESFIAGAGQPGIAFVDLDERIALMEVDVVVVSGQPTGGVIGYLVGLGREGFVLDKPSEGFCISEVFLEGRGGSYTGSQFLLVITTGEAVYLS
jgi:hypothetical protein